MPCTPDQAPLKVDPHVARVQLRGLAGRESRYHQAGLCRALSPRQSRWGDGDCAGSVPTWAGGSWVPAPLTACTFVWGRGQRVRPGPETADQAIPPGWGCCEAVTPEPHRPRGKAPGIRASSGHRRLPCTPFRSLEQRPLVRNPP